MVPLLPTRQMLGQFRGALFKTLCVVLVDISFPVLSTADFLFSPTMQGSDYGNFGIPLLMAALGLLVPRAALDPLLGGGPS